MAPLHEPGRYYILVYSAAGDYDDTRPYRLDLTLQPGRLQEPPVRAQPVQVLNSDCVPVESSGESYRTLIIYNSARILATSDDAIDYHGTIVSFLLDNPAFQSAAGGAYLLDLGPTGQPSEPFICPSLNSADQARLDGLYAAWDAARNQPLIANEVAKQIWYIINRLLDRAPASGPVHLPNIENILIVGDDDIIPFYRVPDETAIGNEREYFQQLNSLGILQRDQQTGLPTSAFGADLFFGFVKTDDLYGDRVPTLWRGRHLLLPDQAVGRLAAAPPDISQYLVSLWTSDFDYAVEADLTIPGYAGGAYVSGYDFLTDQAQQVSGMLGRFGFIPNLPLNDNQDRPVLRTLINDTWDAVDLRRSWFNDRLEVFTPTYTLPVGYFGVQTDYHLMSVNAHFSHYEAIPADIRGGTFRASQLLDGEPFFPELGFFRNTIPVPSTAARSVVDNTSLIYSVGCHSGLTVPAGQSGIVNDPQGIYRASFPAAALKHGGNWIGNTGFGYGDSDVVGYSERLSLLFTAALGREVRDTRTGENIGPTIGESLVQAKRRYLETAGPGGFSVYDEKALLEFTLYGLPFIRVRVPTPYDPANPPQDPNLPWLARAYDEKPMDFPASQSLQQNSGRFTRVITIENTFRMDTLADGSVPRAVSTVRDSFKPDTLANPIRLPAFDQTAIGGPVLPTTVYDITLQPNPTFKPGLGQEGPPEPRGIRLISVTTAPVLSNFNPQVTTIVTDQVRAEQQDDSELFVQGVWLPEQPYTYQRLMRSVPVTPETPEGLQPQDLLSVTLAQFRASDTERGELRRFERLVFEISYIDPRRDDQGLGQDTLAPLVQDVSISLGGAQPQAKAGQTLLSATVSDDSPGAVTVTAMYTTDGEHWQRVTLQQTGPETYSTSLALPAGPHELFAIVEAIDSSGNVAVEMVRSSLRLNHVILPLAMVPTS